MIALHVPQGHNACAAVAGEDDQDADVVAATLVARWKTVQLLVPKWSQKPQQPGSAGR